MAAVLGVIVISVLLIWGTAAYREMVRQQNADAAARAQKTVYPVPSSCAPGDLEVRVNLPDTVAVGAGATVNLEFVNQGVEDCLLDTSAESLTMLVTSGGQTVWDSQVCPAGDAGGTLLLPGSAATAVDPAGLVPTPAAAGLSSSATASLHWDGKVSGPGCAADKATVAGAGTYHLRVALGSEDVLGDRVFVVR